MSFIAHLIALAVFAFVLIKGMLSIRGFVAVLLLILVPGV
jgi:hypothetical protein